MDGNTGMNFLLELDDVYKSFAGTQVLRGVSAQFEPGMCHAIVGPNGSGKSVLMKVICGLLTVDAGSVRRSAAISKHDRPLPGAIGAVIDRPAFLPLSRGFDNLKDLAKILNRVTDDEIRSSMEEVGLDPNLKQRVRNYSLGMKQKLGLAQALMEHPPLLVLDEPLNALDSASVETVRKIIRARVDAGSTVIFTSHNSEDIKLLADRVWQLHDGKLELTVDAA